MDTVLSLFVWKVRNTPSLKKMPITNQSIKKFGSYYFRFFFYKVPFRFHYTTNLTPFHITIEVKIKQISKFHEMITDTNRYFYLSFWNELDMFDSDLIFVLFYFWANEVFRTSLNCEPFLYIFSTSLLHLHHQHGREMEVVDFLHPYSMK